MRSPSGQFPVAMSQFQIPFIQPWLRLSTLLLLASLGLHGIVLSLPLPEPEAEPESSAPEETTTPAIDVVALPRERGQKPPAPEVT
ncbi:hypothetical protein C7271_10485, partial [filamentous cyanobacterium CCP5]